MKTAEKPVGRNRTVEARAKGKRLATFEITSEFDALIEAVREQTAGEIGTCTRLQALERMGREGARRILKR